MAAPPVIGLTGAMAAGKSAALSALAELGAATLSTDAVTHDLYGDPEVVGQLTARWGAEVAPGGVVDRARVGELVFQRGEELRWLEGVLHPLVGRRMIEWRSGLPGGTPLAVVEVPLLFEAGMEAAFDATLVVVADDEVRRRRAAVRGTSAPDERSARQLTQEEKVARATYTVDNSGSLEALEARLRDLWPTLIREGPHG